MLVTPPVAGGLLAPGCFHHHRLGPLDTEDEHRLRRRGGEAEADRRGGQQQGLAKGGRGQGQHLLCGEALLLLDGEGYRLAGLPLGAALGVARAS